MPAHSTNRVLEALPANERAIVMPLLQLTLLRQHTVLAEVHDTVTTVYFPTSAVVSLVIPLHSGETIETAMCGHDGVVGGAAMLDGPIALSRATVQLEGSSYH